MDFKSLLNSLDQLSEATEKTKTGLKHTAEPGGYGRKDDEDDEGKKVKADAPKKGRGRPKKDADDSGEVKKYDTSTIGKALGAGSKPKKEVGTVSKKHSLKEYFDSLDKAINEAEQLTIEPAKQNTQVIRQGTKTLGTVSNPQLAAQIKQSIGKGEMSLNPNGEEMTEEGGEKWIKGAIKHPGAFTKKAKSHGMSTSAFASKVLSNKEDYPAKTEKQAQLAKTLKKMHEAEMPSHDGDMGAGLGAGRSQSTFEGKKKGDGNLANNAKPYDKVTRGDVIAGRLGKDEEGGKKKVKESMDHRLKAAHHAGKAHALSKQGYNCSYDDLEEARMYHEGFKEGLDECYGQMPVQGYVGETGQSTVDDMASFGAHTPSLTDEGNAFTGKLASTPAGDKFSFGGKTYTDNSSIEEMDSVFESWDKELNTLLTEYDTIQEGLTVSISKGQQGAPDSVSVTAQDAEADQLLGLIKQAGLGLFGDEVQPQHGQSSPMSLQPADAGPEGGAMEIDVVDDHDGMMDLIKKVTGADSHAGPEHGFGDAGHEEDSEDYADEEGHDHTDEGTCNECGMMESECGCDHGEEQQVDEVESEDQMTYEVAEDNAPDSDEAETSADEDAEAAEDQALATVDAAQDENQVNEWANEAGKKGTDEQFETDIAFMTKVISGGLNKEKIDIAGNGQSTIPVTAVRISESASDWKKLAGIK
jgi:hypothetical protein